MTPGDSAALEALRPVLFGEAPLDEWPRGNEAGGDSEPWASFRAARTSLAAGDAASAIVRWRAIAAMPGIESRHVLQAWFFLRSHGVAPAQDEAATVLAAVADIPVDRGRDLLVAYRDGGIRYFNYSGKASIVEPSAAPTALQDAANAWLAVAQQLATLIGPWDKPALPALAPDQARLLMLTPSGPRFGQGPLDALMGDPKGAGYITAGASVLQAWGALHVPG
jgi:hypothetical protein